MVIHASPSKALGMCAGQLTLLVNAALSSVNAIAPVGSHLPANKLVSNARILALATPVLPRALMAML